MDAHVGPERGSQRRVCRLDDADLTSPACRGRSKLGTDPAGADDGEPAAADKHVTQRERVVDGPQEPLLAWPRQPDRPGPGGDHQPVEAVLSLGCPHAVPSQMLGAFAEPDPGA